MTSMGLKRTCTFLARWAILAIEPCADEIGFAEIGKAQIEELLLGFEIDLAAGDRR